jgi:outer membrane protein W
MRHRVVLVFPVLVLLVVGSARPLHAQEKDYFTVSGGWSWPAGGPVQDTYQSGLTLGAAFRVGVAPSYLSGIEFGYGWYSLDSAKLAEQNPGSTFSGGDMGLLSITTENDYLFGATANAMRPFLNLGIGYYKSFIDDATQTIGSTSEDYSTGVYKGSFFGFHAGIGTMINRDRFGLRLDANYQHLFAGGPDLEYFTARAGIVFYMEGQGPKETPKAD